MAARLSKSIKATSHAGALKKARRMLAGTSSPYTVDKVEFTVERKGTRYYRVWVKGRK
jgi:hypothetical protein